MGWGGGGVKLCQSEGTHQIVMSFLPPVVGCFLKKVYKKGVTGTPGPPSGSPLVFNDNNLNLLFYRETNNLSMLYNKLALVYVKYIFAAIKPPK